MPVIDETAGDLGATGQLRTDLATALRGAVSGEVRSDAYSRHLYSRDASMYAIEPLAVVLPRDADDVAAVVSTAETFGVPVLPRGAGTSLAGQTVGRAIVMDFSRHLNKIIEINPEQRTARVQPGVVQEQLNLAAARHGLMFGPDTSTANRATLGGMIGNNSAGSHSVRFGMTIDHVLGLDVVLSDASRARFGRLTEADRRRRASAPTLEGTICRELPLLAERHSSAIAAGFPKFWRQSGGYRLDRLSPRPAGGADSGSGDGLDLASCPMRLWRGDQEVSAGSGAACLGHPAAAVAWLAVTARSYGQPLRAGEIVLSGALGPMVPVAAGDRFTADIGGLGQVTAVFKGSAR